MKPKNQTKSGKAWRHPLEAIAKGEQERARLAKAVDAGVEKLWRARIGNSGSGDAGAILALVQRLTALLVPSKIPRWELDLVKRWERERATLVRPQRLEALGLIRQAKKPEHAERLRNELAKLDPEFAGLDLFAVEAALDAEARREHRRSAEQVLAEIIVDGWQVQGIEELLGLSGGDVEKIRKQLVNDGQSRSKRKPRKKKKVSRLPPGVRGVGARVARDDGRR